MRQINAKRLDLLNKTDGIGMRFVREVSDCDGCKIGKSTQRAHPTKTNLNVSNPFGLVYIDLIGPISPAALGSFEYASKITDEYTKCTDVFLN